MTLPDLANLERLLGEATAGPWEIHKEANRSHVGISREKCWLAWLPSESTFGGYDAVPEQEANAALIVALVNSVVVLEDLKVKNMTRKRVGKGRAAKAGLNRAILDQGWGIFRTMLAYKLAERGGELVLVPANDTSRTCAECGVVDKASRSGARFSCVACGHEDDADLTAAINILRRRTPSLPVEGRQLAAPVEAGTSRRTA